MTEDTYDLIVIGGGPAGMMAAGRAAERGKRVLLLERGPETGRKLLITGSGRCNVTNTAPLPDMLKAFGKHGGFLRDAFNRLSGADMIAWLHSRGVETVEERRGRIFPASQDAHTIRDTLLDWLKETGAHVLFEARARALQTADRRVTGVMTEDHLYATANALIATGGTTWPKTGSTGDGYDLARSLGHSIVEPRPSLVALATVEPWPKALQGVPIKNASFKAVDGNRTLAEGFGEALWTHYGVTGPAILDMSRELVPALEGKSAVLRIDFRPTDNDEDLDRQLIAAVKRRGKQQIKSVVSDWVPERTARVLVNEAGIDPKKKMSQCSKKDRRAIVDAVKRQTLRIKGPRPMREAIVTAGGVALKEIDPRTMQSRLIEGLYFAGEVIDVDGPSGGYNLQAAFSTGYLAGDGVA